MDHLLWILFDDVRWIAWPCLQPWICLLDHGPCLHRKLAYILLPVNVPLLHSLLQGQVLCWLVPKMVVSISEVLVGIVACMLTWPHVLPMVPRAQTPCLQSSALQQWLPQPSQTLHINLLYFLLPQKQIPCGMLVIVYLYLFWPACQHLQTRALGLNLSVFGAPEVGDKISSFRLVFSSAQILYFPVWGTFCKQGDHCDYSSHALGQLEHHTWWLNSPNSNVAPSSHLPTPSSLVMCTGMGWVFYGFFFGYRYGSQGLDLHKNPYPWLWVWVWGLN